MLHDRFSGKVLPGAIGGAPRYLDNEEEEELVRWLEGCAKIPWVCKDYMYKEVRAIVGAKKQNLEPISVSHGWWDRFRAQHPHLSMRTGESLAYVCAVSTSHPILDKY